MALPSQNLTSKNSEEDVNNSQEDSEASADDTHIADDTDREVADTTGENTEVVNPNLVSWIAWSVTFKWFSSCL